MKTNTPPAQLAERLRQARRKASPATSKTDSRMLMERMFRNGSDKKPNPWFHGREKADGSSTLRDSANSPKVFLR